MSTATVVGNGSNFLHTRYDRTKMFLGDLRTIASQTFINSSGGELTYPIGTLLGRVSASTKLVPLASAATDGSETPVGLLTHEITLADAGEASVTVAIVGNVIEGMVVLNGADTMDTLIGGRTIRDLIHAETSGVILIPAVELSGTDNDLS
jgi:hypothetical protein